MKREMLPIELVWEDDGHLGEVALAALADGEDALLPANALLHAGDCESCAKRLGEAALLSIDAGEALRSAGVAHAAVSTRSPLSSRAARATRMPVFAIAAALVIAALGALPHLAELPSLIDAGKWLFTNGIPLVVDIIGRFIARAKIEQTIAALSVASTVVMVMGGILVARARSKEMSREGVAP